MPCFPSVETSGNIGIDSDIDNDSDIDSDSDISIDSDMNSAREAATMKPTSPVGQNGAGASGVASSVSVASICAECKQMDRDNSINKGKSGDSDKDEGIPLPWIWSHDIISVVLSYCDRYSWDQLRLASPAFNAVAKEHPSTSWPTTHPLGTTITERGIRIKDGCFFIQFSHNGDHLACASDHGRVKIWRKTTGAFVTLTHRSPVLRLQFSPNDLHLAVLCTQTRNTAPSIRLRDTRTWSIVHNAIPIDHHDVDLLSFDRDGRFLFCSARVFMTAYTITKFRVEDGRVQRVYQCPLGVRRPILASDANMMATLTYLNPHYRLKIFRLVGDEGDDVGNAVGHENGNGNDSASGNDESQEARGYGITALRFATHDATGLVLQSECDVGGDGHQSMLLGFSHGGKYLAVYHNRSVIIFPTQPNAAMIARPSQDKSTFGSPQVYFPLRVGFMRTWREQISFVVGRGSHSHSHSQSHSHAPTQSGGENAGQSGGVVDCAQADGDRDIGFVSWSVDPAHVVNYWSMESGRIEEKFSMSRSSCGSDSNGYMYDDRIVKTADNYLLATTGGCNRSSGAPIVAVVKYSGQYIQLRPLSAIPTRHGDQQQ